MFPGPACKRYRSGEINYGYVFIYRYNYACLEEEFKAAFTCIQSPSINKGVKIYTKEKVCRIPMKPTVNSVLSFDDAALVELTYLAHTRMPGESHRRYLLCSCDVFRAPVNSLLFVHSKEYAHNRVSQFCLESFYK